MDDRQLNPPMQPGRRQEAYPSDFVLSQGFRIVGWPEHQDLIAEGHYRCPHCRRADTLENSPIARR